MLKCFIFNLKISTGVGRAKVGENTHVRSPRNHHIFKLVLNGTLSRL